jgi:hypothetical protein
VFVAGETYGSREVVTIVKQFLLHWDFICVDTERCYGENELTAPEAEVDQDK